jgi:hypothetical protein
MGMVKQKRIIRSRNCHTFLDITSLGLVDLPCLLA